MKKLSFEASIQELEEIVAKLENGEESLEESLKLFEKARNWHLPAIKPWKGGAENHRAFQTRGRFSGG